MAIDTRTSSTACYVFPSSGRLFTAFPFTIAGIGIASDTTNDFCICAVSTDGGDTDTSGIYLRGDLTGDPAQCRRISAGTGNNLPQSSAYTAGVAYSVVGVFAAANDTKVYLDGAEYTDTTSLAFSSPAPLNFSMGCQINAGVPSISSYMSHVQQCAVWDAALTAAEAASLGKRFSPRRIRPQNLLVYAPLLRTLMVLNSPRSALNVSNLAGAIVSHHRTYGL